MSNRVFPPSSDMVELVANGDRVVLWCLICDKTIGETVDYLNQAILVWYQHAEEESQKNRKDEVHGGVRCGECGRRLIEHEGSCA